MIDGVRVYGPEETRERLLGFVDFVESQADFTEPNELEMQELSDFQVNIVTYETGRSKNQIAPLLNMNVAELEALCIGKSVLDIGCGEGKFARDIAGLKKTRVVALDQDSEVLNKVPERKNLEVVHGSGFDLQEALDGEEFDVVMSAYSSLYWAKNPQEIEKAVSSAMSVCRLGGVIIFAPVIENIEYRKKAKKILSASAPKTESEEMIKIIQATNTRNWLDRARIKTLITTEEEGQASCTFASSRLNGNKGKRDQTTGMPPESYSAVLEVIDK